MFWVGVVDRAGAAMNETCEWLRDVFAGPRGIDRGIPSRIPGALRMKG